MSQFLEPASMRVVFHMRHSTLCRQPYRRPSILQRDLKSSVCYHLPEDCRVNLKTLMKSFAHTVMPSTAMVMGSGLIFHHGSVVMAVGPGTIPHALGLTAIRLGELISTIAIPVSLSMGSLQVIYLARSCYVCFLWSYADACRVITSETYVSPRKDCN